MPDTAPAPFLFHQGTAPLLISMPHAGTHVPPAIAARLTPEARQVPDTDWHLPRLYDFAQALGASILVATHSRYVVDLNRPPDGASLYPGQSVTGLCPVDTFDDTPIYAQGDVPGDAEIWTTVDGEVPKAYRIRIEKVNDADPHRNMILRVTDRQLLAKTGGIVQGMSGSPILQNGRLVGAVTHVLVNDPTRGYGIFAQTMLKQARAVEKTDDAAQP